MFRFFFVSWECFILFPVCKEDMSHNYEVCLGACARFSNYYFSFFKTKLTCQCPRVIQDFKFCENCKLFGGVKKIASTDTFTANSNIQIGRAHV